jgi:hypothetical protein
MSKQKSDVYVSGRSLGNSVKVSLHEPGPSRFALTSEWVRRTGFQAPEGRDRRLAVEWERPRPRPPRQVARPFSIVVPYDEVLNRGRPETGQVVWVTPPAQNTCIHFDIIYAPAGAVITSHPGARSMGTKLVGEVHLIENVYITKGTANVSAEVLHGNAMAVPLPDLRLNDIGKKSNGRLPAKR